MQSGIIIGGSKGLGKDLLDRFPRTFDIISLSRTSSPLKLDLRAPSDEIKDIIKEAIEKLSKLDFLLISSGMGAYLSFNEMNDANKISLLFKVNTLGPIDCYIASRKALLKSKGKCIFITSAVADHGARGLSIYAATKGAINAFVKSEARTAAKLGYAVCAISPGWFESDMTKDIKPELKKNIIKFIPEKRMAKVDEISDAVISILDLNNWAVQGQIFKFTGGY